MTQDLMLRRKWSLRAHGQQLVLVKKSNEKASHVIMKALLWALYLPTYPGLTVERAIGTRYKPDLVSFEGGPARPGGHPSFWGEAGQVAVSKLETLFRRYPHTHFAVAKWDHAPEWRGILQAALSPLRRQAPVDLLIFPLDSGERFITPEGHLEISFEQLEGARFSPPRLQGLGEPHSGSVPGWPPYGG